MVQPALVEPEISPKPSRPIRPVDLVHLAKQCLGDEDLEIEILRLFDTTLDTYLGRLKLATGFDDLAINIHSIRGAAAGVGAWNVADLAKAMETELRDGRPLSSERIEDLGLAVGEARDFIARLLADKAG